MKSGRGGGGPLIITNVLSYQMFHVVTKERFNLNRTCHAIASVAQLVEQRTGNPKVGGSNST